MADQLKSILHFIAVPAGGTVSLPHELHIAELALIPDRIEPDALGLVLSADDTNVTAQNITSAPVSANVLCEAWHSIERDFGGVQTRHLVPQPFIPADGLGLAGGFLCPTFLAGNWLATGIGPSDDDDLQLTSGQLGVIMQRSGSIVGISDQLSGKITSGTITATVTKNGNPLALSNTQTSSVQSQIGWKTQAPGIDTYVAGDLIGIHITTDASFAAGGEGAAIIAFLEAIEIL